MKNVGVLFNPAIPNAASLGADIEIWLIGEGVTVWKGETGDKYQLEERVGNLELLIVLGGDGTTLLGARAAAPKEIPVFGVNLGKVGFLSEANPATWKDKLSRVIAGNFWIERRLMLHATVKRDGREIADLSALNDIVVSRGSKVRIVRFHLYVDGDRVITYSADGLISATPTGSTAYSMAAGGPLLPPELQNFLVIPVAPHLSFERPIVFHQEAQIMIQVEMEHEAVVAADGQDAIPLMSGDEVIIRKHTNESHFARVDGSSYFYDRLMEHLSYWSRRQQVIYE
ncbi:MAG: NAD(+)/NADH kinase [Candidatus Promineifilaceae bacterium]|jgi:NAD+ kinase